MSQTGLWTHFIAQAWLQLWITGLYHQAQYIVLDFSLVRPNLDLWPEDVFVWSRWIDGWWFFTAAKGNEHRYPSGKETHVRNRVYLWTWFFFFCWVLMVQSMKGWKIIAFSQGVIQNPLRCMDSGYLPGLGYLYGVQSLEVNGRMPVNGFLQRDGVSRACFAWVL